jgi:Ice-binding-like/Bacterial Ig-like domain
MKNFDNYFRKLPWLLALVLIAFASGCGGGGDGKGPILGGSVPGTGGIAGGLATGNVIVPGAVCAAGAGPTIPTVTSSDPTSGNQVVSTSTSGVANSGKLITATFSLAMNAATINSTSFTLKPVGGAALTPASVGYNAATKVATLTTGAALLANTSYTAIITVAAMTTPGAVPLACSYSWNFKTAVLAAAGLAPINMGLASSSGIAAHAGITNTLTAPLSHIEGDVILDPLAQCNAVAVDNAGGFGLCGGAAPTINGSVLSANFDPANNRAAVIADLQAAFLSITPPAGPPAAGSLGAPNVIPTDLPAGTTLGAPTGNAMVQGDNYFVPGLYQSLTSILITGDLTLDAGGDPNAMFVFQSSRSVGTAAAAGGVPAGRSRILLINGAKASNVWWQAATDATLGSYSEFQGNILAARDITMVTGSTSCGRLMAGAWVGVAGGLGAFIFDSNVVSLPGKPFAPPATYSTTCQ